MLSSIATPVRQGPPSTAPDQAIAATANAVTACATTAVTGASTEAPHDCTSLDQLPRELLVKIAGHMSTQALLALFLCSRMLHSLQDAPDTYAVWLIRRKGPLALHFAAGGRGKWNDRFTKDWRQQLVSIIASAPGTRVNFSRPQYYDGLTPLMLAVFNKLDCVVGQLLKVPGINVNMCPPPLCASALHMACEKGNRTIVALLLAADGINVNILDYKEQTPLSLLLWTPDAFPRTFKHPEVYPNIAAQLLAREDIDLNSRDEHNETCLHHAIQAGMVDVVTMLLRDPRYKLDQFREKGSNGDLPIERVQLILFQKEKGFPKLGTQEAYEAIAKLLLSVQS